MMNQHYHLTQAQKRIWYIEQIYPNTSIHNIGGPIRMKGALDFGLLEKAINAFIKRHDGLRLQLVEENGTVKQYIAPYRYIALDRVDFSGNPEPEREFDSWVLQESRKVFQLYESPLFYFAMFKIAGDDNGYFVRFHHLIADGWTIKIMTEQIRESYIKLQWGETVPAGAGPSYLEYIAQEQEYLQSERFIKDREFWNEKFKVLPEYLGGRALTDISSRRRTYRLPEDYSAQLKSFCSRKKLSLNTFFTAAFLIYRFKTTQQTDIVLGIPVLNRSGPKQKQMVGMFTSSMPFRIIVEGTEAISNFLDKVHRELVNCYFHQKYPYNLLAQDLKLKQKGIANLFDTCVNYYNTRLITELDGLPVENTEFHSGNQIYALQLVIKDWSEQGGLTIDFDYQIRDYDESRIDKMYRHLKIIIDQLLHVADVSIHQIELLSPQERQYILCDFNKTAAPYPRNKTIHQLFEDQVQKTPQKIAVSFRNQTLTYFELNQKANQLAHFLRGKGVGRESIVGLLATHSLETVIAIMGILKAGAAYLPVDLDYPSARIRYLLNDSGACMLLTNCPPDSVRKLNFHRETVELTDTGIYTGGGNNLPSVNTPDDLAYVIYTSGSTGQPKGVMIEHRGLVNYIWWACKTYLRAGAGGSENQVFALYSSLAFDLTVTSIFAPLVSGHQIYIPDHDGTDFILSKVLQEKKATIVKLTPAHLSLLLDRDVTDSALYRDSAIRCFIVGGEDFKTNLAALARQSFGPALEIYNEYGPTETVVGCMIHRYDPDKDKQSSVPIGTPADNVQVYLLDKYLQPVPPGVAGEIYISGDGLARGYLKRPDLTGERFIDNPFYNEQSNNSQLATFNSKLYKTGDLARFLDNGELEYLGRVDYQVKIHGRRIELGEIEGCLQTHPAIKAVVVIDRDDAAHGRGKYLCAYYVAPHELPAMELRKYLSEFLPEYMIPLVFMRLNELPLTVNGKVNRSLLPEPRLNNIEALADSGFRNEKEAILAGIIKKVLAVERVGVTDNFLQLGGDSIKAIQIAAKLKERSLKLKVKDILAYPVIAEMAARIETDATVASQEPVAGLIDPTPVVAWFFSREFKNPNYWNQSVLLNLAPQVDINKLDSVLDTIIKHHDSLRINYNAYTGKLYYNPAYLAPVNPVKMFDLSAYSAAEQTEWINTLGTRLKSGMNLENGLLFIAAVFDCGPRGKKLLLSAHHLIVDGVSWRIILDDLACLLEQAIQNRPFQLPKKTFSYQKWAAELANYSQNRTHTGQRFWETVLDEDFQFPTDYNTGEDFWENCRTFSRTFPAGETEILLAAENLAYRTRVDELLVIALALTVGDWTGKNIILIELEGHGREEVLGEIDVSRTVGWFTSMYPVRLQIGGPDLSAQIKSLKEQLRGIPNKGFDFGVLKYLKGAFQGLERRLIRFNYLGDFDNSFRRDLFELAPEKTGLDCAGCNYLTSLLEINAMIVNRELRIEITFSRNKFADETVQKFSEAFLDRLRAILRHCRDKEQVEFTPADFDTVTLSQSELDNLFA